MQLRNRLVKANFWTDTELAKKLPATGRMMYQGLWQLAEDSGCIEADPVAFKMILFPLDDISLGKIEQWTNILLELDKLIPYQYQKKEYYYIKNFHKHQSLRSPGKPELPLPEWIEYMPNPKPYQSGGYIINYEIMPGEYEGILTVGNVNEGIEQPNNNRKDTVKKPYGYPSPTNKKEKENKNIELEIEEEEEENKPKFDNESIPYKTACYLREKILENNSRNQVPQETPNDLESWSIEMDKLNRLGPIGAKKSDDKGYTWEEISMIIDWCQADMFWKSNILSAGKFREKIVQLENQMKSRLDSKNHKNKASPEEMQVVELIKNELHHDITDGKAKELFRYADNNIDLIKEKIPGVQSKSLEPAQAYYCLETIVKKTSNFYKGYR